MIEITITMIDTTTKPEGWKECRTKTIQVPKEKLDVIEQCLQLMERADKLSASDIIDRSEYEAVLTWTAMILRNAWTTQTV